MKRNTLSGSSSRDENIKSTRGEDSKSEEDRARRRREWIIEQERQREHERLKRKKILEYELRRAREKGLPAPKGRSSHRSRSKSPESRNRSTVANAPRTSILSEKLEPSGGTTPLFKGPEGTQASVMELRSIKVDIHRNIPGKTTTADLQRDILSPEDVVLKRRAGEGSKPIFEREEIKAAVGKDEEIEERRSVVAVRNVSLENKSKTSSKYATPSHSVRPRSYSPECTPPHHSRCEDSKRDTRRRSYRCDSDKDRSRNQSRERKDGDRQRRETRGADEDHLQEGEYHRDHSRSRDSDVRKRDRDSSHHSRSYHDERSHREYRDRSRERSRERRDRDRSRELRVPPPHYIEQIPVPIYCGNFAPRPIMVSPLVPVRGHVPLGGGNRHFPMMGPIRPFPPRFAAPPSMYRLRPPSNPRFRQMY